MCLAPRTKRRARSCWTCKSRKIGCDRASPACNNCLRTGRDCQGYGFRLVWPEQHDGRRKPSFQGPCPPALTVQGQAIYASQFLNITYADFLAHQKPSFSQQGHFSYCLARNRPCQELPLFVDYHEKESHLLKYYQRRLSGMISTIDARNGFRDVLLPMALTASDQASHGLLNAVFALAAFHLWGSREALPYKATAISLLSSSLDNTYKRTTETQMATSMMLCVYNVFDEEEGDWAVHLGGAANMLQQVMTSHGGRSDHAFLCAWFLYHEVLGTFSQPLHQTIFRSRAMEFLRKLDVDMTLIVGPLGCSIEVMEIVAYANSMRATQLKGQSRSSSSKHATIAAQTNKVWNKAISLKQKLDSYSHTSLSDIEQTRILLTAELYRLAALIYLSKASLSGASLWPTAPDASSYQHTVFCFVDEAMNILQSLDTCTSPWPLFIVACELQSDEQRIEILQTLDKMDNRRNIGNVLVLRAIIESFWKQQDLRADGGQVSNNLQWWDVIDLKTASPWFI